jgi:uncharacterized membrane protein YagU involved in acid resistance
MPGAGGLVAEEVAVGPRVKEGLVTFAGTLPQGKGYRAVGMGRLEGRHKIAENFIGIVNILPALEHIGPETQHISRIGAVEDFLFGQPVTLNLIVAAAYSAVIAVVFTVIGKFNKAPDINLGPVPLPAHLVGGFRKGIVIPAVDEQPQPFIVQVPGLPQLFN